MDRWIAGKFGMERSREDAAVLDEHGLTLVFSKNGNSLPNLFDDWTADEDHFEGFLGESAWAEKDVAGELAAVAVAKNGDVEKLERSLFGILDARGEKNRAGTGAEDGVLLGEFSDGVVKALFLEELQLRGGFAARENEAIAGREVGDGADFDGVGAEFAKTSGVGFEVALDGEDSDFEFGQRSHV